MTKLNLDDRPGLLKAVNDGRVDFSDRRISVSRVITIIVAILGWVWAFIGSGTGAVAKDYVAVRDRVNTLETQRTEDLRERERQRGDEQQWREKVDRKLDSLLLRLPRSR